MDPEELRRAIPALDDCVYLNTGASGPSPRPVVEATNEAHEALQYEAPCADGMYGRAEDVRERARETVAGYVGATPDEIALSRSTVEGINAVAGAIDWEPGDVVVRTDLEHPAGTLTWDRLAALEDVEVRVVPTERGRIDREALSTALEGARLLCCSSLSWNYGTRLPVAEMADLAHDAGARILVDAVQSVGQAPVDVEAWDVDFLAASGHKWLLSPWGTGVLYVASDALPALEPRRIGYRSVADETDLVAGFVHSARRFEHGTAPEAPNAGLAAAIQIAESVGIDVVQDHVTGLRERLVDGLGDRLLSPPDARSGLVTFAADDPAATVDRLAAAGIRIRSVPEPAGCRASLHVFNTAGDVDRLLAEL